MDSLGTKLNSVRILARLARHVTTSTGWQRTRNVAVYGIVAARPLFQNRHRVDLASLPFHLSMDSDILEITKANRSMTNIISFLR